MREESGPTSPDGEVPAAAHPFERRVQPRVRVSCPADACVLLPSPEEGGRESAAPIRDISHGGVSFRLTDSLPAIEEGWTGPARLRFGSRVVRGNLLVVREIVEAGPGKAFGAMFFAAAAEDRRILREILSELGAS
jgi:hypothetical protein